MISFALVIAIALPFSMSLDICGLQDVRKCDSPTAINCVENLLGALIQWSESNEAIGYFVTPIDPLYIGEIEFETGDGLTVTLTDVTINGLGNGQIVIANVEEFSQYYRYENSFNAANLEITAGSYSVSQIDGCSIYQTDNSLGIQVENIQANFYAYLYNVLRCTGVTYLNVTSVGTSTTANTEFSQGPLDCQGACSSNFINELGPIIVSQFVTIIDQIYNKVQSDFFYDNIDIEVTNGITNQVIN